MKLHLVILITSIIFSGLTFAKTKINCNESDAPKVVKPMDNWEIIATNTANITMSGVFTGDNLSYTVYGQPKNENNVIKINKKTGLVKVHAEKKDNFDIIVKAKNQCGEITNSFNVIIDEEE